MNHLLIATLVFLCVAATALVGMVLRVVLPDRHLKSESLDAIKLATGLVATLAALVLGLLVSSSKHSMDEINGELVRNASRLLHLDQVLQAYGPGADSLRAMMIRDYRVTIDLLATDEPAMVDEAYMPSRLRHLQDYQDELMALPADDDFHRQLRAQAVQLQGEITATHWLLVLQRDGSITIPLLTALVVWLLVIFAAFGLLSPRNAVVVTSLLLCALSASAAIFLILEMDRPLDGMIRISLRPLVDAMQRLTN